MIDLPKDARIFFKVGGKLKILDISKETSVRCTAAHFKSSLTSGELYRKAYDYAASKGDKELTEERLNEFLDTLGVPEKPQLVLIPVRIDKIEAKKDD